jgi:hypothetical protein
MKSNESEGPDRLSSANGLRDYDSPSYVVSGVVFGASLVARTLGSVDFMAFTQLALSFSIPLLIVRADI